MAQVSATPVSDEPARPKGRRRTRRTISTRRFASYVAVLLLVAYAALPMYWTFITAVRPVSELLTLHPAWLPGGIQLDRFAEIWSQIPLAGYLLNSAIVVLATVLVGVTVAALGGYALSRFEFPGNAAIFAVILFTQTIPTVVLLVPFYTLLHDAGLINTRVALPLSYTVWAVPYATLILRGYFRTAFSRDLEDAARVDGCSRVGVLVRIVFPLSLPGLMSAAMLIAVFAWNEFLWASLVASQEGIRTVSVGLNQFVGRFGTNENLPLWMAGAVFVALPPIILYIAAQRFVAVGYGVTER
jgi:ABC-type glycerol-3-phosphate transport system permease component